MFRAKNSTNDNLTWQKFVQPPNNKTQMTRGGGAIAIAHINMV